MKTFVKILTLIMVLLLLLLAALMVPGWVFRSLAPTVQTPHSALPANTRAPRELPTSTSDHPTLAPTSSPYPTLIPASPTAASSPTPEPAVAAATVTAIATATTAVTTAPPTPIARVPLPQELGILLLGTDKHVAEDNSWRTDSIIILAVHPQDKKVGMMSIPRDLWVMIPGRGYDRINIADFLGEYFEYPGGGPALLQRTIEENLGIPTKNYVRVDIDGLKEIVDTLEYITVEVSEPVEDWFLDPAAPDGWRHTLILTGTQTLDGQAAVDYARSRHNCNDFKRARRQQQVLRAIGKRALQLDVIPRAWQLWTALNKAFDTDLTWGQIASLLPLMAEIDPGDVRSEVIDYEMASDWTTPKGARVLLPNREAIEAAWRDLLADRTPTEQIGE